jgi:agmatinase
MKLDFLGLPPAGKPVAAIVPVPWDATSSYGVGARGGPAALLAASHQIETWAPELGRDLLDWPVRTEEPVEPELQDLGATIRAVERRVGKINEEGLFPLCIGGDHSITSGAVAACSAAFGPLTVLQIDAHMDLREAYQGAPYSHASVMRRCHADHGAAIVPVGIRSASAECMAYSAEHGIDAIWAREIARTPTEAWVGRVVERLRAHARPVYVTVDLDGLDPSVLPDTGTPEPGGLGWYDLLDLVDAVASACQVVAADITELLPGPDSRRSAFLAARLLAYMLPRFVRAPP